MKQAELLQRHRDRKPPASSADLDRPRVIQRFPDEREAASWSPREQRLRALDRRVNGGSEPVAQRVKLGITYKGSGFFAKSQELDTNDPRPIEAYIDQQAARGHEGALRLLRERVRDLDYDASYYIGYLVDQALDRIEGEKDETLPPLIHFIWMGRPIRESALNNILQWAARAKNTDWRIVVWTDKEVSKWESETMEKLGDKVIFRDLYSVLDPRIKDLYDLTTRGGSKAFNMASDLARYSILRKYGGVYADVDLGPGYVDLSKAPPKMTTEDLPMLAPEIRDQKAKESLLGDQVFPNEFDEHYAMVDTAYERGEFNNNLIAAQKGSLALDLLLKKIAEKTSDKKKIAKMGESLSFGAAMLTGPVLAAYANQEFAQRAYGIQPDPKSFRELRTLFNKDVLDYFFGTQWLTPESEIQEYDLSSKQQVKPSSSSSSGFGGNT